MSRAHAGALLVIALGSIAACAQIAGLDDDRHLDDGTTCDTTSVPGPPSSAGGGALEILVAVRSIDLGENAASDPMKSSVNLDGACSCPGPTSCVEPMWAAADHCDNPGGRDNAAAQAWRVINEENPLKIPIISSSGFSGQIDAGAWSLLIRVTGYNGMPDDADVAVTLFASPGLGAAPNWDGKDAWSVADVSLVDKVSIAKPISTTTNAYVSGGVLVVSIAAVELLLFSPSIRMAVNLSSVVMRATIEKASGGGYRLSHGILGARWKVPDMMGDLGSVTILDTEHLCTTSTFHSFVKQKLCSVVDIPSGVDGPASPCNAMSFGVGFEADPALLGPVKPGSAPSGGCTAQNDPGTQTCGK